MYMRIRRLPLINSIRFGTTVGLLSLAGLIMVFVGVVYLQYQTEQEAKAEVLATGLEYVSTQLVAGITWSNTERIQDFVLTSTGKPRLVYADSTTNALHYGSCDTDCDSLGNWTFVQIFSGIDIRIEPALALDSSDNPRVIYKNHYLFCDTSCTSALNWTAVNVGFGTGNDFNSLAITTDGKPRFVFGNNNDPASVLKYAQCDTTCSNPANWTIITADSTLGSGFFSSVVLTTDNKVRVAHTANISGSVNGVSMSFCDTNCDLLANWSTVVIDPGPITTQYTTIALNSSDNPRIFTGAGKYYFCDASCELAGSWIATAVSGTANVSTGYHKLLLNTSNNPRVLFSSGAFVNVAQCDAGCNLTGNWSLQSPVPGMIHSSNMVRGDIDTSDILHFSHFGNQSGFSGTLYYTSQFQRLGVVSVSPTQNADSVSAASNVVVVFDGSLNTATVNQTNLPLWGSQSGLINGVYSFGTTTFSNDTVTFNPTNDFKYGEHVKVVVSYNVLSPSAAPAVPYTTEFYVENVLADGTFLPRVDYSASGQPTDIEVGDLDNDGDLDIATSNGNFGTPNLGVFMNNGDGTFAPVVLYSSGLNPRFISLGDLNNDGFLDAVLSSQNSSQISVFMNNGNGTFAVAVGYSVGASTGDTDIGDVDMDGDNDIVVISVGASDTARVFLNNGSGVFGASTNYTATSDPYGIVLGDFDNDGDQDMVVSTINGANVLSRYSNNGNGTFAAKVDTSSTGNSEFVTSGDYDGDGNLDIALTLGSNNQFSVFIGNGDGTFDAPVNYTAENVTSGINNADVDADGDLDIIVTNRNSGSASVFLNNGSGVFALSQHYPVSGASSTAGIATGDLNGDGAADMAVAGQNSGQISVLMGNVPNSAPTAPTGLFSNNTTAQTGTANPADIEDTTPAFSAICNDSDVGDIMNKYQVQVDNNSDFSSVVWDSGALGTAMSDCAAGGRSADIVFGATPLALDGTVYYWRIKFWDDSNTEGAFSENPTSTNSFTMRTQRSSQLRLQPSMPNTPSAQHGEFLNENSIRWYFTDTANNETGFRLIDATSAVVAEQEGPDLTFIDETGLMANTLYEGRRVVAYNAAGASAPSELYSAVATAMPEVRVVVLGSENSSLTVGASQEIPNFSVVQTGLRFELMALAGAVSGASTLDSGWIQSTIYTFENLDSSLSYQVRIKARNQQGIETEWSPFSPPVPITEQDVLLPAFSVQLGLSQGGKNVSSNNLVDPLEDLSVDVDVNNYGSAPGTNVFLHIPLPENLFLLEGSLQIDGSTQTSAADVDEGQGNGYAVSAIWDRLDPGQSRQVSFVLRFDQEALRAIEAQPVAASNPLFILQASVGSTEITEPVYSTPFIIEADLAVFVPVDEVEPVEEPVETEPPVTLPTQEETVIIDQIIEETFTPGIEPAIEPAQTTSSYDAGSFSISVQNGTSLVVTGFAQTHDEQIEFTGTTSEPFTVVTLIFNDSVTSIVVSDANGNWRTFVSAESLGVLPGQEQSVKIEAIAAKGDLRSERVVVGQIQLTRAMSGQVIADFETIVSSNSFTTTINEFRRQAVQSLTEQEPILQTTLTAAAPIIVISSVPLWGYLPYAPVLIQHLFVWLFGLLGRRKGRGKANTFGVVYDSITKQPLPLAIVRVYSLVIPTGVEGSHPSQRKLVSTLVTDQLGRYDLLLPPGSYRLSVSKPQYSFPSQIVTAADDGGFDRVYQEERGMSVQKESVFAPHIPLDPFNTRRDWQLASLFRKSLLSVQRFGEHLAAPLLLVGFLFSLLLTYAVFTATNVVIACVYFLLLAAQLKLRRKLEKAWGVVFEIATNAVLPLTAIQLIDPAYGKVVASRLSDYEGRFSFLPQPGDYVVKASKPGYEQVQEVIESPQVNRRMLTGQIRIDKPGQRISGDVAMKISN